MKDPNTIFTVAEKVENDIEGVVGNDWCQDDDDGQESLVTGVQLRKQEEKVQRKLKKFILFLIVATVLVISLLSYWILNHPNLFNTSRSRNSFVEFLENLK